MIPAQADVLGLRKSPKMQLVLCICIFEIVTCYKVQLHDFLRAHSMRYLDLVPNVKAFFMAFSLHCFRSRTSTHCALGAPISFLHLYLSPCGASVLPALLLDLVHMNTDWRKGTSSLSNWYRVLALSTTLCLFPKPVQCPPRLASEDCENWCRGPWSCDCSNLRLWN